MLYQFKKVGTGAHQLRVIKKLEGNLSFGKGDENTFVANYEVDLCVGDVIRRSSLSNIQLVEEGRLIPLQS
jgi:hypothetical protein